MTGIALARSRAPFVGAILVATIFTFALFYPLVSGHSAFESDFVNGATSDGAPRPPLAGFLLGTDRIYRDVATRLALGARLSLYISLVASAMSVAIGTSVGVVSGYFEGRWLDAVLMRLVDVGLSFPFLLLVMALGVAVDRTTATTVLLVLGVTGWLSIARIVRAKTIQLRSLEFVLAARAMGARGGWIMARHLLPNLARTMLVLFAISTPQMMMADSVLSYLGAGIAPPTPTLGYMLFEGQDAIESSPWMLAAPAATISLAVLGFHLVAEGLEGALGKETR